MGKFLETYNLPKLNHEEIENLNRPITSNEIESVIKKIPNKQKPRTRWLPGQLYHLCMYVCMYVCMYSFVPSFIICKVYFTEHV